MTREEFKDWVMQNGCSITVIDPINVTGNSVKIINDRYPSQYAYVKMLPMDDRPMPAFLISEACEDLNIKRPPGIR